jgi:ubiquinol-cytochrome c reductase cytochrome c subunit
MRRGARVCALLAIVTLALLGVPERLSRAANAEAPMAQDAVRGSELFVRIGCYQCHGYVGQGGSGTGPRLAPSPIAFDRFTRAVWDPIDLMPRYAPEFVSEGDLADIYAYLQSVPPPPRPEDVPLLNP